MKKRKFVLLTMEDYREYRKFLDEHNIYLISSEKTKDDPNFYTVVYYTGKATSPLLKTWY